MDDAARHQLVDIERFVYDLPSVGGGGGGGGSGGGSGGGGPKVSDLVTIHCTSAGAVEPTLLRPLMPSCDGGVTQATYSDDFVLSDSFGTATCKGEGREDFSEYEADRAMTRGRLDSQTLPSTTSATTAAAAAGARCSVLENTEEEEEEVDVEDVAEEEEDSVSNHSIIPWLYDLEADEDQRLLDSEDSGSELKTERRLINGNITDTKSNNYSTSKTRRQEDVVQGTEESDGNETERGKTPGAPDNSKGTSVNDITTGSRRFQYDDRSRLVKNRTRMRLVSSSSTSGSSQDSSEDGGGGTSPEDDRRRRCPTVRICKTTPGFLRINPRGDAEAAAAAAAAAEESMDPARGGRALLSRTLDQVRRRLIDDLSPVLRDVDDDLKEIESAKLRSTYIKNLLVLSLGFMLVFTSFCALRSLQSSINHDGGLGLAALSCMNATFALGCVFATSIVQRVRPKRAIMLSLIGHLLFTIANIHATFYTLLPATAVIGFTMATLLVAQGTYLTSIAVTYAAVSGKKHDHIVSLFNGFFLFMLQISQILGNLISSTVFSFLSVERDEVSAALADDELRGSGVHALGGAGESSSLTANQTNNFSHYNITSGFVKSNVYESNVSSSSSSSAAVVCGSGYCHMFLIESMHIDIYEDTFVVLVAFLCMVSATGMVVIGLLLDKLDVIFHKSKQGLVAQLCAIVRLHRDRRMRLCVPLMTFLGIQEAFVYAEFTKGYVTCPLGLHMIGYVMMCFAGCASLASVTVGYVQKYLRRSFIIITGAICHLILMTILYLWQPSSSDTVHIFLVAGGLGIVDALWQTEICSLCGVLFDRRHREASFSSLRMYQSLGLCLALGYAQFLCADVKIVIMAAVLVAALVAYFALEVCEKTKHDEPEAREPASI